MKPFNYETLKESSYNGYIQGDAPERVLQFGEGNFLRAFVDYFIDVLNEEAGFDSKVILCQPIKNGLAPLINEQEGLYTLYLRGFEHGKQVNKKRVISCVSRCLNPYEDFSSLLACAANPDLRFIVCNTTEAGIIYDPSNQFNDSPANSYPGKLTQFLYRRFELFHEEAKKGMIILSCELIDDNGKELKKCVLQYAKQWNLGNAFIKWIEEKNLFCSTLVDRIVTGYPRTELETLWNENGYKDQLLNTGEIFGFWVIEGPEWLKKELPFDQTNLPVLITPDHKPYKLRKVRILNGAHTTMVLGAYLAGFDIVRDCMEDETISRFMNQTIYQEVIPTLTLKKQELEDFAQAVTERFKNPFIDHSLLSISLNSTAKWKARVLPTMKDYIKQTGELPKCISASLAFYILFYKGVNQESAIRTYQLSDDAFVLDFFKQHQKIDDKSLTHRVLSNVDFWGEDLTCFTGLETLVASYLSLAQEKGCLEVMKKTVQ